MNNKICLNQDLTLEGDADPGCISEAWLGQVGRDGWSRPVLSTRLPVMQQPQEQEQEGRVTLVYCEVTPLAGCPVQHFTGFECLPHYAERRHRTGILICVTSLRACYPCPHPRMRRIIWSFAATNSPGTLPRKWRALAMTWTSTPRIFANLPAAFVAPVILDSFQLVQPEDVTRPFGLRSCLLAHLRLEGPAEWMGRVGNSSPAEGE